MALVFPTDMASERILRVADSPVVMLAPPSPEETKRVRLLRVLDISIAKRSISAPRGAQRESHSGLGRSSSSGT